MKKLLLLLSMLGFSAYSVAENTAQEETQQEPIWDANKIELVTEDLGNGVYVIFDGRATQEMVGKGIPLATTGGFIVGDNEVLQIESMLNKRLYDMQQNLLGKVTDKKVKYVVNTSYHGDHSYGNDYVASDVQIIQHEKTAEHIRTYLKEDKEFMMQNFGTGRGIEEIKGKKANILLKDGETYEIDLGNKKVEIISFGFLQTEGDLYVWDPEAKVLFVGNAYVSEGPGLPWLLDGKAEEALATAKKMYDFLPDGAIVVPGHSRPMKKEDINWYIDYLTTLINEVQNSIDEGLTLDQTVKKVTMEDFRGYAIFDWVHSNLNVVKTYEDLKK